MPVKLKKGDSVWCRPLDRMAVVEARQWVSGLTPMYKVGGCEAWFTEEQLAGKDVPLFREASANGASQPDGIRLTDGSYERGDGSIALGISPRELGEALLESGERNKRALNNEMVKVARGRVDCLMQDMFDDPLKWIELLARFQRERLEQAHD